MSTKQTREEITIRKTMMYKRGAEMIKALETARKKNFYRFRLFQHSMMNSENGSFLQKNKRKKMESVCWRKEIWIC